MAGTVRTGEETWENLTIGCSHTFAVDPVYDWVPTIQNETRVLFDKIAANAMGLTWLVGECDRLISEGIIDPSKVKRLLIQKPGSYRSFWWGNEEAIAATLACESYFVPSFKSCHKAYKRSKNKEQASAQILEIEIAMIRKLFSLFPNSLIAHYFYWLDYIHEVVQKHLSLAEVQFKTGRLVEELGGETWGMLLDPHNIEGVYDSKGDFVLDTETLAKNGWILSTENLHGREKWYQLVTARAKDWISRTEGRVAKRNTRDPQKIVSERV